MSVSEITDSQSLPEIDGGSDSDHSKPLNFAAALLSSFVIFNAGFVLSQTLRWTNHLAGFANGLLQSILLSIGWAMFFLPWSFGVFYCFSKKVDNRRRTQWVLAPAWLILIFASCGLILDPPTVEKRFERLAKVDFPTQVDDLNTNFMGGGVMDFMDTYYFKTSSAEIDRIIREKEMVEDESFDNTGSSYSIIKPLPGSADFRDWEGAKRYEWFDSQLHWFCEIITDSGKTQAYIFVGCT